MTTARHPFAEVPFQGGSVIGSFLRRTLVICMPSPGRHERSQAHAGAI
jgi:hypothetical protein